MNTINFESAMQKMNQAGIAGAKAGKRLRNAIISDMMTQYKSSVGRLPGSNKTKRLKKKRVDAVSKWYSKTD